MVPKKADHFFNIYIYIHSDTQNIPAFEMTRRRYLPDVPNAKPYTYVCTHLELGTKSKF